MRAYVSPVPTAVLLATVAACGSSMSVASSPLASNEPIQRLAIAPGSGPLGEAIGLELFNAGLTVVEPSDASAIVGRVGLQEFEVTSNEGYAVLRESGVDAVLTAKTAAANDGTPESASVRITSTQSGEIMAGLTWQNDGAGKRGSIADRMVRKNLSDAASEIANELKKRLRWE